MQVQGNLVAPNSTDAWTADKKKWIQFRDVQGLVINGGGTIDGQGLVWWKACGYKDLKVYLYMCQNYSSISLYTYMYILMEGRSF